MKMTKNRFAGRMFPMAVWLIAVALTLNLGRLVYQNWKPRVAHAAPGAAHTVVRTESGFDKAGTLKYTNEYVEAARSDGSTMWMATTSVVKQRRINFANGDQVLTNELLGRKSTYPRRFTEVPGRREPGASCLSASDIKVGWRADGIDSIGAHRAVRQILPGSPRSMTSWHALDAGCALLQLRLEHEEGVTVQNLSSLVVGEPSTTLFEVRADFNEVPPSGLLDPICKGDRCSTVPDEVKQRLDKNYRDIRAKVP